ncbi:TldD/PmbA family protein [Fusibacter paucivorans]|uniref:TldD/PmbA family protein n=1 Tax=Fusibacter paucivorans TaxID=76009 RepID=A0ABS5PPZ8_9FIRM|nr:TldD/PmbA family protein [Fusibacter paucivorans]MBS7527244.1 TldD/PmbA family protein [Fusibacter paucivorans]
MMFNHEKITDIFNAGERHGVTDQEVYYQTARNVSISVFNGEIEKYSLSEEGGLSYRAIIDGKMGYTYTENASDIEADAMVLEAIGNAEIIEADDEVFIFKGSEHYETIDTYNPEAEKRDVRDKIQFMLDLEKAILAYDPRVKRLSSNNLSDVIASRAIVNSKGLDINEKSNYCLAYAMVVVEADGDTRTGMGYDIADDFEKLSAEKIIKMAVEEALTMLGAKPIKSMQCPVVVKNDVFAQFFSAFTDLFSADRVQKNLSKLKGKLETKIASETVTVYDDPHLPKGLGSTAFDAEGVATYKKALIEQGTLRTFLHNLKSANKDDVVTTGNAAKGSYKGTIGIAPFNVYIEPGSQSFNELLQPIEKGIYIVSLQGLHAGINTISGDFSLQCYGYVIETGRIGKPTSQITVSGNFFELLNGMDAVGDDLAFTILGSGYTGSPSVRISGLTISGI